MTDVPTLMPTIVPCPHCKGCGTVSIPPGINTIEAYYFGCKDGAGHYWFDKDKCNRHIVDKLPPEFSQIDDGFCPGAVKGKPYERSRSETVGEAALHYVNGWTVLSFWDRSVDLRVGSNSNFVVLGLHSYATIVAVAKSQFPFVFDRIKFEINLVEDLA